LAITSRAGLSMASFPERALSLRAHGSTQSAARGQAPRSNLAPWCSAPSRLLRCRSGASQ
jgi:hypothetical protein